uniref:Uncharacterized protein n=1 Tax=Palpitomonas bilix TaxID=652834 RepID=A0A7S3D1R0_9EUKA|mmetsp:Transcript_18607/g.46923  ORF Transcript_18607/g.46923 Transcript_18607/m.46923 type:complete len:265 (+) Transcript_18607:130-924(+)
MSLMRMRRSQSKSRLLEGQVPNKGVRILVVGDSGVGKTTFCKRICSEESQAVQWTVGCEIHVLVRQHGDHVGEKYCVDLVDIGGSSRFEVSRAVYYSKQFDGVIYVHDLSDRKSLASLPKWKSEIFGRKKDPAPLVPELYLGNKNDVTEKVQIDSEKRAHHFKMSAETNRIPRDAIFLFFDSVYEFKYEGGRSSALFAAKKEKLRMEDDVVMFDTSRVSKNERYPGKILSSWWWRFLNRQLNTTTSPATQDGGRARSAKEDENV